ncbi:MAG TPA: NADH:ubiquinone reductase (Na(+)-transporting) subunit A, partial [Flavobacteriales bacterium]|nr:NADH:ubiquinone reductase (Na(+)-transporting) subunit A [Flavobacteriales bacterium]
MSKAIKIKRGLNIRLKGEAEKVLVSLPVSGTYAVKPTDFHGLTPKVLVKEGDAVKAGSVLFIDKYNDRIRFVSPVSGKVSAVVRGEKRKVLEILVQADAETSYETYSSADPKSLSREALIESL